MNPIEFLFAENVVIHRGPHLRQRLVFCAATERSALRQTVEVHWAGADGRWRVTPAHATPGGGERRTWLAEVIVESSEAKRELAEAVEFALCYRCAEGEWWHKDGERNLRIAADAGVLLGEPFAVLNLRPQRLLAAGQRHLEVHVAVREACRPCTVEIRWSPDRWRTVHRAEGHFVPGHWHRAHSDAPNPGAHGVGVWTANLPIERAGRIDYAIACAGAAGVCWDNHFGADHTARRRRLKVLTLNLHCYQEENWDAKFSQIARVINEREIDIVCFQEVAEPWNGGQGDPARNAAGIIRGRLERPYHLVHDWSHLGFGTWREGSAILTRHDLVLKDSGYVSTSVDANDIHARKVVMAQVDVPPFGRVNVFSTHLSWWSDGFQPQFENLRRWADGRHTDGVAATLLCGDFNARPDSQGYAVATFDGGYEDQYLKAVRKAGEAAAPPPDEGRIDYIFLKRGSALEVVEAQPLFTPADYGAVSDHPAYYAEFELAE